MNRALFVLGGLLLSSPAFAAGAAGDGIPLSDIGIHAINFVLMYGLLAVLLHKPIRELLKQRQASIRQDLEDAASSKDAAQARHDALSAKLDNFDAELARMTAEARKDAAAESELARDRTERDGEMMREMTSATVREETRNARSDLQRGAVDLAVKLAEEKLRGEISGADHGRLAGEFLTAVKGEAHA